MKITYMNSMKKRLNMSEELLKLTYELLEKLRLCGYISNSREMDLVDALEKNVNKIIIGTDEVEDIKSGYYDAHKKELYIKDIKDKKAVFQRLLYAMTSKRLDSSKYMVGFSSTSKQKTNYKYKYEGFGINRAIVADLASKLCDTSTDDMTVKILYKTYKANFLGYDIIAENDNYYLESNLFKQLCFVINERKESMYKLLFEKSPIKALEKVLKKSDFEFKEFIKIFDDLSKKYSNYNKVLAYVNALNYNYNKLQRVNGRTPEEVRSIELQNRKLSNIIKDSIKKYSKVIDDEQEINSNEFLENIESEIADGIIKLQNILIEYLADDRVEQKPFEFATRLKQFSNMLIVKSDKLEKLLYEVISTKILMNQEITSTNLIEKIKYSIINEIISTDKYKDIYAGLSFRRIEDPECGDNSYIVVLSENNLVQVIKISNLEKSYRMLNNNTNIILTDNFKHILNADYFNEDMNKIEKIFTAFKDKYPYFNKLRMEDINYFKEEDKMYLMINYKNALYVSLVTEKLSILNLKMLELSETYSIFTSESSKQVTSLLPVLYKEKKGIFDWLNKLKMILEN